MKRTSSQAQLPSADAKLLCMTNAAAALPQITAAARLPCMQNRPRIRVDDIAPFPTTPLHTATAAVTVLVHNDGNAPLDVQAVALVGAAPAAFILGVNNAVGQIAPGASRSLQLHAQATSAAAIEVAALRFTSNDPDTPTLDKPLEASAYELVSIDAPGSPIAPDVDDAGIHYVIRDPRAAVGSATITLHEIDHASGAIGRVIDTFGGLPHGDGDHPFAWRGALAHQDYVQGFVNRRRSPYRVKVVIALPDGTGARELTCDVAVKDVGELRVTIARHDGAALGARATFHLVRLADNHTTGHTTLALAAPHREELIVKGLVAGRYEVQIQNLVPYLAAEALGRIGPERTGRAVVEVKIGERARTDFELTPYDQVQFIGFHATPTGGNRQLAAPDVMATYRGEADDRTDMIARCEIMKKAMADAAAHGNTDPTDRVLKVFMAPEFYFRGQGGGYPLEIIEEILPRLLVKAREPAYANWLFVYGTAIGYLKHGDAAPDTYALAITQNLGGAPQRVRVQMDATLPRDQRCAVAVCGRIPAGAQAPLEWKLRQNGADSGVWSATRISDQEYELEIVHGSPALVLGAVVLVEPLSTEVFNVALVQRGGPSPGGPRDLLVYKDYVSSIDFLGRHHPDVLANFYAGVPTHRADIHGTGDRLIVPTVGSADMFSASRNPAVAGGTSEHSKSGLGGGALFSMAGLNFAVEPCLDHLSGRLNTYAANATPGDPKPQVHLIPSWGMTIAEGPIYTVANGLVFNVDGRVGCAPQAGIFAGNYRCPDAVHNGVLVNPPSPIHCAQPHYRCPHNHPHYEAAANCSRCGMATIPMYQCTQAQHYFLGPACTLCGNAPLPPAAFRWCAMHGGQVAANCATCGAPTAQLYVCNAPVHDLSAAHHDGCAVPNAPAAPWNGCPTPHAHTAHAPGNCVRCGAAMVPEQRKIENDWVSYAPAAHATVADPMVPLAVHEQTIVSTTRVTVTADGSLVNETTVLTPVGAPPIVLPTTPPTTNVDATVGNTNTRTRTWVTAPLTLHSEEVVTTVVGAPHTIRTTVVTTRRTGNVTPVSTNLFAANGEIYVYPVQNIPEAEMV